MKNYLKELRDLFLTHGTWWKKWKGFVTVMAMVVVFVTTYALILPAITLEKDEGKPEQGVYLENVERGSTASLNKDSTADPSETSSKENLALPEDESDVAIAPLTEGDDAAASDEKTDDDDQSVENQSADNQSVDNQKTAYAEGVYSAKGDGYTVFLDLKEEMKLPEDIRVTVEDITEDQTKPAVYRAYTTAVARAAKREGRGEVSSVRIFKVALFSGDKEIRTKEDFEVLVVPKPGDKIKNGEEAHALVFRGSAAYMIEDLATETSGHRVSAYRFVYPSTAGNSNWGLMAVAVTAPKAEDENNEASTEVLPDEEKPVSTETTEEVAASTEDEATTETEEATTEATEDNRKTAEKLTYQGEDYKVVMTCDKNSGIPEDAELQVTEITEGSKAYKKYLKEARETLDMNKKADPKARFFDIKIMDGDKEIEPKTPVSVKISYDQPMEVKDGDKVDALHFGEKKTEVIEDLEVKTNKNDDIKSVTFEAESFSVYGVVTYTVDFTYDGYTYSINGNSTIKLSRLVEILGIAGKGSEYESGEDFVKDVENVTFSDESLVKVEKAGWFGTGIFSGDDWELVSLKPFTSHETLTIVMQDKTTYIVEVTDLQYTNSLNDVLTELTISGADWDSATQSYTVKPGKVYNINMAFQEGEGAGQYQFSNDGWMTLYLPDGVTFETGTSFDINVNEAGENFTITGNQVLVEGGQLKVKLNNTDPNYQKLKDITTAKFTLSATGRFDSSHSEYTIDGQTDTKIKVDNTPDVNVTKAGSVIDWNSNPNTATVEYVLNVTSNGAATGVEIKDYITGTGLTYNQSSATVTLNGQQVSGWTTTSQSNTGFTMRTGDLLDGQTYQVKYTATINKSQLVHNSDGTYSLDANNKVDWTGDKTTTHDLGHVVTKPGITKSGSTKEQNGSETITTWTIQADSDYGTDNQLKNITDRIATDGVSYVGDGIHIVVIDKDTNTPIKNETIPWASIRSSDGKSWTYDVSRLIDNTGKKYHYTITYDTKYDIGSATSGQTITNNYEDNRHNEGSGSAWVNPNPENRFGLEKQFLSKEKNAAGDTIVTWTIKVTVPASGLSADDAILTDVLPSTDNYQDTFVSYEGATGLYSGESVDVDSTSEPGKVLFTFKKSGSNGLNESTDHKAREIVLTLKTKCDPTWLADNEAELTHTNEAIFHNEHRTAHYIPDKPSIKKDGWRDGEVGGLPKYSYSITAGVFSDDLFTEDGHYEGTTRGSDENGNYVIIEDTFDNRLSYVEGSATVGGGDQNNQENGRSANGVTATVNDNKITFKLYQNALPKNGDNLYQYYKINYSLQVKDQDTLNSLRDEAISTGKAVELENSVEGFGDNHIKVDYEPKILDKSHQIKDGKLEFTIKVNEEGLKLSDNGVLVLTDSMTNLSVRYQDVTIVVEGDKTVETTDAEGNPVTAPYFNMKGNDITFYIPDEAKVTITYIATPRGEVGSDGKIHYSNTAKLKGFEKKDSGEKEYESEASGYGTNYAVYLYKADGLVNSNALAGAVFKLYEADEVDADGNIISGTPVKKSDGTDYTVTTSDGKDGSQKGVVRVMGTEALGWNLKPEKRYYLLEVVAPPGYALDSTKYQFTISKEGYVNYTKNPVVAPDGSGKLVQAWTYHNGDVMTVKNYRKDGVLVLEKGFEGLDPSTMDDDQKAAIKFDIYTMKDDGTETLWRTITYDQFVETTNADGTSSYNYTIGDLPEGKYKVVESVDDVTCRETVYAVTDSDEGAGAGANNDSQDKNERYATVVISAEDVRDHTENKVNVTNTYNLPSEFKIYKHAEGETSYKLKGAEFGVYAIDSNNQPVGDPIANYTTNSRGRFSILQTDEDGQGALELGKVYALKETKAPEGFLVNETVTYFCFLAQGESSLPANAPNGTKKITWKTSETESIEDTPDTTYLEATKVYLDDLLEEDETINDPVDVRIKQIASYDKEGQIIESELSGYYKIGASKPVKPDKVAEASTFQIIKENGEWHLSGDGITDGKLTNLPTLTFDNHIPIYYHYEVEEINPGNYFPSYEYTENTDGGTFATVTNKPDTNVPTTKVKAKKKWIDVEGEDVTSKMGLDDGISVDVYRYPGMLTKGTIIESDGSMRDPTQLFGLFASYDQQCANINTAFVSCLPGDILRITVTPKSIRYGKDFSQVQTPDIRFRNVNLKERNLIQRDLVNKCFVVEYAPPNDITGFSIEDNSHEMEDYDITVENITSVGRTQVLTQADLDGIPDSEKKLMETLDLNKANGWQATSKEYVAKGKVYKDLGDGVNWHNWQWVDSPFTYFIVEPDGMNYEAEYTVEGDSITVTNVEKKLEVDKTWFAANGEDDLTKTKEDGSVTYTIKRNKYTTPIAREVSVSKDDLAMTGYPGNIALDNTDGIKVGATVKMTLELPIDQSWVQIDGVDNDTLDGLTITGADPDSIHDSGPKDYFPNSEQNRSKVIREYQFIVTDDIVLSGNLVVSTRAAQNGGLKIHFDVLKEPSNIFIPAASDEAVESDIEVGTVTVGYDTIISKDFIDNNVTVATGETPWSAIINKLPGSDDTYTYTYYVQEEVAASDDFELVSITPSQGTPVGGKVQVVNKLKKGFLKIEKVVEGTNPDKTYEIAVTDSEGNYYGADGKNYGSTPHYETFSAGQEIEWDPMTPGTYTVSEKDASKEGYTWTVSGTGAVHVEQDKVASTTVTNSYFKTTTYTPKITKSLKVGNEEVTPWPDGATFDFYLSFVRAEYKGTALSRNDVTMKNREAQATETRKTGEFGEIEFKKPGTYVFSIEEVEPAGTQNHKKNGIVYSTDKVTLTVVVGEKEEESGVLEVKSKTYSTANGEEEEGLITNTMDYPTYAPSVTKRLLKDGEVVNNDYDWEGKSFIFNLAAAQGTDLQKVIMPSETQKTVTQQSRDHKETFDDIVFKEAGTYTFTVTEQAGTDPSVTYNRTPKTITVEVGADEDNNLAVTKVTIEGTEVTGENIIGSGVTIDNTLITSIEVTKIWKDTESSNQAWPTDKNSITLFLKKQVGSSHATDYLTLTVTKPEGQTESPVMVEAAATGISTEGITATVSQKTADPADGYLIKVNGLSMKESGSLINYSFTENTLEGYKTSYSVLNPDGITATTLDIKESAQNGEAIINTPEDAVELPSTGGPGPKALYLLGLGIVLIAGITYTLRRRKLVSVKSNRSNDGYVRNYRRKRGGRR